MTTFAFILLQALYSFAPTVPLSESKTTQHNGCQAYYMEHRRIYVPDSVAEKNMPYPSNDWWTYGLVNAWTGKLWFYPGWAEATPSGIEIGYPTYWEPTGNEMKWDTPLSITLPGMHPTEALIDHWSDYLVSFTEQDGEKWIRVTTMQGSPLVWIESEGVVPAVTNPDVSKYAVFTQTTGSRTITTIGLITNVLTASDMQPYAFRIPYDTRVEYSYTASQYKINTTFHVGYTDYAQTTAQGVIMGFLPHHYYNTTVGCNLSSAITYATPRGQMRIAKGNDFSFDYTVSPMLPFFPAPMQWPEGFDSARMTQLIANYAAKGNFGGDTYWGGKGLTQMMHYMTFALQVGDTTNFRLAKSRLRATLEDWYTYTPGEKMFYFARYPRWGALVGMDPSYDSDTFNDHHFHYGYFVYASAVLCLLDDDFKAKYGAAARELARDYACWERNATDEPWFRMLNPYLGHSFAGGMGNAGNGNGQESSSEAMQSWGGVWMLGMALGDEDMIEAGIFGYTLESRATAEYWFDRGRRNIDYTKYNHPYCCNLTMQGVGWWTWFSGDPVWMHSIQWLPTSPILTNYLTEDLTFAQWDYTQMYAAKQVGGYEADSAGLGDESGLGNVCLSYLALFDPDSAAHVWDRAYAQGKNLAKNPDTGGITYWLTHSRRAMGGEDHTIRADYPLAAAYTHDGEITYAVYNADAAARAIHYSDGTQLNAPAHALTLKQGLNIRTITTIADEPVLPYDSLRPEFPCEFPNIALGKPCTESSHENAGSLCEYATDGDLSTRWGSAHQDNEWIQTDLGVLSYIDHVIIRWEAAYASRYTLAFSADGNTWRTFTYNGGGGVERQNIGVEARYVRLTGLQRGTAYGTSLYELEVYGLPKSGDTQSLYTLCISSEDEYIYTAQTPTYVVKGYTMDGTEVAVNPTITPAITTDNYSITATAGGLTASYSWPILEAEMSDHVVVLPTEAIVPLGESQVFRISTLNQFGEEMAGRDTTITGAQVGDLNLHFDTLSAVLHVVEFTDYNIALHKTTYASGTESNEVLANQATDGNVKTRWSSRFRDNEWLEVDLGAACTINRVRLLWEESYATAYQLLVSTDGLSYRTIYTDNAANGGTDDCEFTPVSARFVRVLCITRSSGYGASLWEMEVYGTDGSDTTAPVISSAVVSDIAITSATLTITASDNVGVHLYRVEDSANGILMADLPAAESTIPLTNLEANTTYNLTVYAMDLSGNISIGYAVAPFTTDGWGQAVSTFCQSPATRVTAAHEACDPRFTWQTNSAGNIVITISAGEGEEGETYFRGSKGMNGTFTLNGSAADFLTYFNAHTQKTDKYTITLTLRDAAVRPEIGAVVAYSGQIECRSSLNTNDWSDYAFDDYHYGSRCDREVYDASLNIALGKPATAGAGDASLANDGSSTSRWTSESGIAKDPSDDWWQVDLGAIYDLDTAKIMWETSRPLNYVIEVSLNGTEWINAGSYNQMPATNTLVPYPIGKPGRYVRVRTISGGYNDLMYGISMYEFELYAAASITRDLGVGNYGTLVLPYDATVTGATLYHVAGVTRNNGQLTALVIEQENTQEAAAGTPYIVRGTAAQMTATYGYCRMLNDIVAPGLAGNLSAYAMDVPQGAYVISNNTLRHLEGGNATIAYHRAYIDVTDLDEVALTPERLAISVPADTPTALDQAQDARATLRLINGTLVITCGDRTYNAMGQSLR